MILKYVIMLPGGRYPKSCMASSEEPEGAILAPQDIPSTVLVNMQFVDEAWIDRPVLEPATTETGVVYNDAPAGSVIQVIDVETGQVLGSATPVGATITIDLPDDGTYLLEGTYPLPYLPTSHRVFK